MIDPSSPPAILASLLGGMLVGIGGLGTAFPAALSAGFGIPVDEPRAVAYVRASGTRDVAIGGITLAAALRGDGDVLAVALALGVAISAADFVTVFFAAGRRLRVQHLAHAGGAAAFSIALALTLLRL